MENLENIGSLAVKNVNMFIDSNTRNVIKFCSTSSLKPQALYRCVEYVKQHEPELYKKYVIKVSNIKEEKYDAIISEINRIMILIKTSEIDKTKQFDVLDYFLATGLSPHIFVNIVKVIYDSSNIMIVKNYLGIL
jgi:ribosomal protein S17